MGKIKRQSINISDFNSNLSGIEWDPIIEELSSNDSGNNNIKNFRKNKEFQNLKDINDRENTPISSSLFREVDNNFTINSSEKSDNLELKDLFIDQLGGLRNFMNEKKLVELKSDSNISFSMNNGISINDNSRTMFEYGGNSYRTLNLNNTVNSQINNKINSKKELELGINNDEKSDSKNYDNTIKKDKIDEELSHLSSSKLDQQDENELNTKTNSNSNLNIESIEEDKKHETEDNLSEINFPNKTETNSVNLMKTQSVKKLSNLAISFNNSKKLREEFLKKFKKPKSNQINTPKYLYLNIQSNNTGKDKIWITNKKLRHKICKV